VDERKKEEEERLQTKIHQIPKIHKDSLPIMDFLARKRGKELELNLCLKAYLYKR
jgi:hypothetical protein